MNSEKSSRYIKCYKALSPAIRLRADKAFDLWEADPTHRSLHYKRVHGAHPVFSIRVTNRFRMLAIKEEDTMIWFWVGPHDEYMRILKSL